MPELGITHEEAERLPVLVVDLFTAYFPRRMALCCGIARLIGDTTFVKVQTLFLQVQTWAIAMKVNTDLAGQLDAARNCAASLSQLEDALWGLLNARLKTMQKGSAA